MDQFMNQDILQVAGGQPDQSQVDPDPSVPRVAASPSCLHLLDAEVFCMHPDDSVELLCKLDENFLFAQAVGEKEDLLLLGSTGLFGVLPCQNLKNLLFEHRVRSALVGKILRVGGEGVVEVEDVYFLGDGV